MGIFNMPPFCLDSVTMEFLSFPFLCTCTFLASYKHAHSFCRYVLAEREKLDFSVVFSKAGFLPMDIEIVLMKANKGRTTGSILYQDFFHFLKSGLKINRNSEPWGTIVLEGALLPLIKILPMNSESFAKKPLKFITHMGVLTSNKTDNFVCEIPRATLEFIVIHTLASEVDLPYQAIVGGKWTSSS